MNLVYVVQFWEKFNNVKELLKIKFEISDRLLLKLKTNNKIFLNGSPVGIKNPVNCGDIIEIYLDFEEDNTNIIPVKIDLNIIYEDDFMLIINKPAGIPIHPSMLHYTDSLSNGVRYYFDAINLHKKIRPVNRLDKDTSGIVVFAKNEYIQECLVRQMKCNNFIKEYIAICEGYPSIQKGKIEEPISRKENSIIERYVSQSGDYALTYYETIKTCISKNYSVLLIKLITGRTHQIRVHLSYIGHPIIGDTLYGSSSTLISRQALHSYKVSFVHPITRQDVVFTAPLYEDMEFLIYYGN